MLNSLIRFVLPLCMVFVSAQAFASGTPTTGISVSGECEHLVTPDRGSLVLTSDIVRPTIEGASREATQAYEELKSKIQALGLADLNIQTSEYSLQEATDWIKNKSVHRGYRARMGLEVATSDVKRLGEVIQTAAKLGIQDTGQLQLFLSRPKLKSERESCLTEAVHDAHAKAEKLAAAAGAHVGPARGMSESSASESDVARPMMAMNAKALAPGEPNVVAAPQRIEVRVAVTYELE